VGYTKEDWVDGEGQRGKESRRGRGKERILEISGGLKFNIMDE